MSVLRHPVVAVIGSGSEGHARLAQPVGELLARLNVHLLTGGGGGVMATVSEAFSNVPKRQGVVIGILPCREDDPTSPKVGYPNSWVEIAIPTHLPLSGDRGLEPMSRNHINILASDIVLALPGGPGTISEVSLAIRYKKPVMAFLESRDQFPGLPPSVPVLHSLEDVERFLRAALNLS